MVPAVQSPSGTTQHYEVIVSVHCYKSVSILLYPGVTSDVARTKNRQQTKQNYLRPEGMAK